MNLGTLVDPALRTYHEPLCKGLRGPRFFSLELYSPGWSAGGRVRGSGVHGGRRLAWVLRSGTRNWVLGNVSLKYFSANKANFLIFST